MTSSSSSHLVLVLLANLALATAGCGGSGGDEQAAQPEDAANPAREEPKAPEVGGPADASELTNAFGVFVTPTGNDAADGTRERPLASVRAAIDLGKRLGKRVYVCTGTYREALVLADSISIVGGLDCSGGSAGWRTGAPRTRIESPTSPAIRAKNIRTATRLEGLEIIAPNAADPSSSSIGLLADRSSALVIAASKIVAGDGAKGEDGTEGIQLTQDPAADGKPQLAVAECVKGVTCSYVGGVGGTWIKPPGVVGGTNTCSGAPGFVAQPGGAGGSGGLWTPAYDVDIFRWHNYKESASYAPEVGTPSGGSVAGADGLDGPNAASLGTFSDEGYAPASGYAGTNGATGMGGAGGRGDKLLTDANAAFVTTHSVWRGYGGSGGGAGGCPGLAGTPGTGGGASIAVLLTNSAIAIEATEIVSGRGGAAGRGALGTVSTPGGAGGPSSAINVMPLSSGKVGGRGGAAGTSGNGSNGPSIGIAHLGAAPSMTGNTRIMPGPGGAAIDARTRTDAMGLKKTVDATPAGVSKEVFVL